MVFLVVGLACSCAGLVGCDKPAAAATDGEDVFQLVVFNDGTVVRANQQTGEAWVVDYVGVGRPAGIYPIPEKSPPARRAYAFSTWDRFLFRVDTKTGSVSYWLPPEEWKPIAEGARKP